MLDPKDKTLQPPVRRSWLRLRLGKAYYAGVVFGPVPLGKRAAGGTITLHTICPCYAAASPPAG